MEVVTESIPKENIGEALPIPVETEELPPKPTEEPPIQSQELSTNTQSHEPTKKSKKNDHAKREDKNAELFLKSLSSLPIEERYAKLSKKYTQILDENKTFTFYVKQSDKRYVLLNKEKERLQQEYNKIILVKSKLEALCREFQKQNKAIKEDALSKIREEEELRKETQAKFQTTLMEITTMLQQNNEKNAKLRDDNISMSEKFNSVVQQYHKREEQVERMAKQLELENQLFDAKMQQANLQFQAEKERLIAQIEQLKMESAQYSTKMSEMQLTEVALREQITLYTDKYDMFQNALTKSNQMYGGFKGEMEKMSKKIQKLEKESLQWKSKWETSQTALIDMCTERQASEERSVAANRHLVQMQQLCRTLQAERTALLNTLKDNNIERPPVPIPPPAPVAPPPASNAKVDAMAANCVQLRQSLAQLQNQLNVLTTKKEQSPKESINKPEKTKKNKSKKNKNKDAQDNQTNDSGNKDDISTEINETSPDNSKGYNTDDTKEGLNGNIVSENTNDESTKIDTSDVNAKVVEVVEKVAEVVEKAAKVVGKKSEKPSKIDESMDLNKQLNDSLKIDVSKDDSSLLDLSSNDEISHIAEVKPILDENKTVES